MGLFFIQSGVAKYWIVGVACQVFALRTITCVVPGHNADRESVLGVDIKRRHLYQLPPHDMVLGNSRGVPLSTNKMYTRCGTSCGSTRGHATSLGVQHLRLASTIDTTEGNTEHPLDVDFFLKRRRLSHYISAITILQSIGRRQSGVNYPRMYCNFESIKKSAIPNFHFIDA